MITKRRLMGIAPTAFVALVLLYPYEQTVVPAANIDVLDETGKPFPNALAKQEWIDATVEATQHVDYIRSTEGGHVAFPRRTKRAPLGLRVVNIVWGVLTAGFHADIGSSGAITVYSKADSDVYAWTSIPVNGHDWPAQLTLERHERPVFP